MSEESGEIRELAFLREDIFPPGVISVGQEKKQRHTELIASNNIGWRSVRPFYSPSLAWLNRVANMPEKNPTRINANIICFF